MLIFTSPLPLRYVIDDPLGFQLSKCPRDVLPSQGLSKCYRGAPATSKSIRRRRQSKPDKPYAHFPLFRMLPSAGRRRSFETIAGETRNQVAVDAIMCPADESMAAVYRECVGDERLQVVADQARRWLFGTENENVAKASG